MVVAIARMRGVKLMEQDGTLWPGLIAGVLFGLEFLLIYRGLVVDDGEPDFTVPLSRTVRGGDRRALVPAG